MKTFDVSPLDSRVRDLQVKQHYSLIKAVNIIQINNIQKFIRKGGDTVTTVIALTDLIKKLIHQQE